MVINQSHLNQAFTLKILHACRDAMKMSVQHVRNRKGDAVLAVRYRNKKFVITGTNGQSIKQALLLKHMRAKTYNTVKFIVSRVSFNGW